MFDKNLCSPKNCEWNSSPESRSHFDLNGAVPGPPDATLRAGGGPLVDAGPNEEGAVQRWCGLVELGVEDGILRARCLTEMEGHSRERPVRLVLFTIGFTSCGYFGPPVSLFSQFTAPAVDEGVRGATMRGDVLMSLRIGPGGRRICSARASVGLASFFPTRDRASARATRYLTFLPGCATRCFIWPETRTCDVAQLTYA